MRPTFMDPKREGTDIPLSNILRTAWHLGDRWTRFFLVFLFVGFALPLPFAIWLYLVYPSEVELTFAFAWISGGAYIHAFLEPLLSAPVLREAVRQGWVHPYEEYHTQVAEYLERYGEGGRTKGAVAWAGAWWIIYYLTMILGVLFALTFVPTLGPWTPYVFLPLQALAPVGLLVLSLARGERHFRDVEHRGFRLAELAPRRIRPPIFGSKREGEKGG